MNSLTHVRLVALALAIGISPLQVRAESDQTPDNIISGYTAKRFFFDPQEGTENARHLELIKAFDMLEVEYDNASSEAERGTIRKRILHHIDSILPTVTNSVRLDSEVHAMKTQDIMIKDRLVELKNKIQWEGTTTRVLDFPTQDAAIVRLIDTEIKSRISRPIDKIAERKRPALEKRLLYNTALYDAAQTGDLETVEQALEAGANPNYSPDSLGGSSSTPLYALLKNNREVNEELIAGTVELLLRHGAKSSTAALFQAVDNNWMGVLELLLRAGGDPNGSLVWRPLELAILDNKPHAAAWLIAAGAKTEPLGFDLPPLHLAVEKGHESCVRLLLVAKANRHLSVSYGIGMTTPAKLAQDSGHKSIYNLITNEDWPTFFIGDPVNPGKVKDIFRDKQTRQASRVNDAQRRAETIRNIVRLTIQDPDMATNIDQSNIAYIYEAHSEAPAPLEKMIRENSIDYRESIDEFERRDIVERLKPVMVKRIEAAKEIQVASIIFTDYLGEYDFDLGGFTIPFRRSNWINPANSWHHSVRFTQGMEIAILPVPADRAKRYLGKLDRDRKIKLIIYGIPSTSKEVQRKSVYLEPLFMDVLLLDGTPLGRLIYVEGVEGLIDANHSTDKSEDTSSDSEPDDVSSEESDVDQAGNEISDLTNIFKGLLKKK